ncbi:hypothetical protein AX774_g6088 [Zancudomyces culisetae]|uniref:Uncharacterized protein n=1 Tax=Zancudomyces culisetae TaxID=1213189 RepID=A0A1R1PHK2_ZANCU|nr:hypothetical protein AX774_g6088 [Zancudomyces culisetae]|eukprot:OMH80475.1 hypothetical protein AX774_g6088 [Zancudomyces culisetae]
MDRIIEQSGFEQMDYDPILRAYREEATKLETWEFAIIIVILIATVVGCFMSLSSMMKKQCEQQEKED